jgi:hypothetical protein
MRLPPKPRRDCCCLLRSTGMPPSQRISAAKGKQRKMLCLAHPVGLFRFSAHCHHQRVRQVPVAGVRRGDEHGTCGRCGGQLDRARVQPLMCRKPRGDRRAGAVFTTGGVEDGAVHARRRGAGWSDCGRRRRGYDAVSRNMPRSGAADVIREDPRRPRWWPHRSHQPEPGRRGARSTPPPGHQARVRRPSRRARHRQRRLRRPDAGNQPQPGTGGQHAGGGAGQHT